MKTEKRCCTCKKIKPMDAFCRATHSSDGRQSKCRQCNSEYGKVRARKATHNNKNAGTAPHIDAANFNNLMKLM
ncbi:MAG: hypothetical protein OEW37_05985 [Rhodospirillaceae bacterium]|nr:hypothetical protein [Rhodospirillaceae bacterium]